MREAEIVAAAAEAVEEEPAVALVAEEVAAVAAAQARAGHHSSDYTEVHHQHHHHTGLAEQVHPGQDRVSGLVHYTERYIHTSTAELLVLDSDSAAAAAAAVAEGEAADYTHRQHIPEHHPGEVHHTALEPGEEDLVADAVAVDPVGRKEGIPVAAAVVPGDGEEQGADRTRLELGKGSILHIHLLEREQREEEHHTSSSCCVSCSSGVGGMVLAVAGRRL